MTGKQKGKLSFPQLGEKIRNFLFARKNREFLIFLFFFFISSSFWLMQTLDDTYEYELAVPFRLHDVPEKVVITSEVPSTIRFVVRDRGTVLVNYLFGQSFYPLVLSWNDYKVRGAKFTISNAELVKLIGGQLLSSSRLISLKPDHIDVISTQSEGRKLPVRLASDVVIPQQSYLSEVRLVPDSVLVYAPQAVLDTLYEVRTVHNSIQVNDSADVQLSLNGGNGVKVVPSSIRAHFVTDVYSEKQVEVPVFGLDFPEGSLLKSFPSKATVTFQVGLSHFRQVTSSDFRVGVYYKELSSTGKATLQLISYPDNIKNVRIEPKEVDYLIEKLNP